MLTQYQVGRPLQVSPGCGAFLGEGYVLPIASSMVFPMSFCLTPRPFFHYFSSLLFSRLPVPPFPPAGSREFFFLSAHS